MENSYFETALNAALQQIRHEAILPLNYLSFPQAVLLIYGEKNIVISEEDIFSKLDEIYANFPQKIEKICIYLEEAALRDTVYKRDNSGNSYVITHFEKFNPKASLEDLFGEDSNKTPLYKRYTSYYFRKNDVYNYLNRIHNIFNTSFFVANGYTSEALNFLYAFSNYCTNLYAFAEEKETARIDDIKLFAKSINCDVSQKIIEAVDTMLSTRQLNAKPGRKPQNKHLKHKK